MTGFTFPYGPKDVFVITDKRNKTKSLAQQILRKMSLPDGRYEELLYYLRKAECDVHTLADGRKYYEIHGDNFGGRGSFTDDGNTIIIKLDG